MHVIGHHHPVPQQVAALVEVTHRAGDEVGDIGPAQVAGSNAAVEVAFQLPAKIASELGLDKVMFEAAEPAVFQWYIKNYGPEVNLFVDHSQIVQLECLRAGRRSRPGDRSW